MSTDLESLRTNIAIWLEQMAEGLEPGRFRFCSRGSMVPVQGQQAQFTTCFAMKIAWQTGLWDSWPAERKIGCLNFVKSFQCPNGSFVDRWLARQIKPVFKERIRQLLCKLLHSEQSQGARHNLITNIRAETRQSASTLLMVGDRPIYPLPVECSTHDGVRDFILSFDWNHPWSAGSHLSHLLFMLSVNEKYFCNQLEYTSLIDTALHCLEGFRDEETGCWFTGSPGPGEILNGAMKVFSGLQWINTPYPDCRRLMDFALGQTLRDDGCGFLNQLFVVYHARKGTPHGYRTEDIRTLGRKALDKIPCFLRNDGAFSFFMDGAQTHYYGASVSSGELVSDLHGTTMMTWATAIALSLSTEPEQFENNGWRIHCA